MSRVILITGSNKGTGATCPVEKGAETPVGSSKKSCICIEQDL